MIPKEKAKQLVDTFRDEIISFLSDNMKNQNAKKCALIAVDEILTLITAIDGTEHWQEYYEEVKQEINKL